MFCIACGEKLADGTNICPKCGAKLMLPGKKTGRLSGVMECSEKNQLMVRVPGKGLYFIVGGNRLCLLDDDTGKVRVLTEKSSSVNLCGLGFTGGKLYYWHECQSESSGYGIRLRERDVDTDEEEDVWESDEELFYHYRLNDDPLKARAILYRGAYYLLNYQDQKLLRVSVPDGDWEEMPLPNMKKKLPLLDWIKPRGVVDIQSPEPNFGLRYTGLAILDGYVYLSLEECTNCTLRYPLGQPDKITYLPMNAASAIQSSKAGCMLTSVSSRVYSCPGIVFGTSEMFLCEIKADGNLLKMISNTSGEVSLSNKGGLWWRVGNNVYVGQIALNLYEKKWHKLSPLLFDLREHKDNVFGEVKDFIPGRTGVYLLTATSLYLVPQDWESKVKTAADISQFEVVRLKNL